MRKLGLVVNKLGLRATIIDGDIKVLTASGDRPLTKEEEALLDDLSMEAKMLEYEKLIQNTVQTYLDTTAREHRYDSMSSIRGYTGFPNKFQRECMTLSIWAGDVWEKAIELGEQIKQGTITPLTADEFLLQLPIVPKV